jgi:hypothetical protein
MPSHARAPLARALAAGTLAVTLAGLGTGCSSGGDPDQSPSPTTGSPSGTPTPSTTPTPTPSPTVGARILTIEIADGEATPNAKRVEVTVGTPVRLVIDSDTGDHIHVHGYDKEILVKPGLRATLEFVADETGVFEIESHETERLIYQLVVTP